MNKTYAELALERDELQSENEELRFIMDKMLARGNQLKEENKELKQRLENSVELPCKVGQDAWFVRYYDNKLCRGNIASIVIRKTDPLFEISVNDEFGSKIGTIGQTENVFLTREQAEQRLKEMQ